MAKRNNNKLVRRAPKLEPAVMKLVFESGAVAPGQSSHTCDISQMVSLANRRFYRQGLQWACSGIKLTTVGFKGSIYTSKLPQTWTLSNAWHKAFAHWSEMNDDALAESESIRPRFLDFKIYANATHHLAGYGANMLPMSMPGDALLTPPLPTAVPGEWESSKMVIPIGAASPGNTADREIIAVGDNYPGLGASGLDAVSLIQGYANSRGLPNVLDPNAPSDADDVTGFNPDNWLGATFSEGTDQTQDVLEFMISENNIAPYPFENDGVHLDTMYPGGHTQLPGLEIHDVSQVTNTTIGATTRIPGGLFPCGLIQFVVDNSEDSPGAILFELTLVPGSHRGYLAEPMQDM